MQLTADGRVAVAEPEQSYLLPGYPLHLGTLCRIRSIAGDADGAASQCPLHGARARRRNLRARATRCAPAGAGVAARLACRGELLGRRDVSQQLFHRYRDRQSLCLRLPGSGHGAAHAGSPGMHVPRVSRGAAAAGHRAEQGHHREKPRHRPPSTSSAMPTSPRIGVPIPDRCFHGSACTTRASAPGTTTKRS